MTPLLLSGLDGSNPLGFLAALGLLRVLDDHALRAGAETPRLGFVEEASVVPVLVTGLTLDEVVEVVLLDAAQQAQNAALQIAYSDAGIEVPVDAAGATMDLKPPPGVARAILERVANSDRRVSDLAAAWFSEFVQDNNGNTKPTSFHFTAGQQAFLQMVAVLRTGISGEDVREALIGPWSNVSRLPSLSWDASVSRLYALRAGDPSSERRGSVPAANWLGVVALGFFPVFSQRGRLVTTRVKGGWKDSVFTWPLWQPPLACPTVGALLRIDPRRWDSDEREAVGILRVHSSRILRSDQGGYGSFTPAEVDLPVRGRRGRSRDVGAR